MNEVTPKVICLNFWGFFMRKGVLLGNLDFIYLLYKDIFQYKKYSQDNRSGCYAFIVTTQQI